ncbi:hypothetical protein T479_05920 [Lysinibacillus varians]|nr:hypothetical protein T479_05920 [Lysinibacillus varians]
MSCRERPDVWDEDGRDIERWENDGGRSNFTRYF